MIQLATPEIWFITGSRHLYGPETLNPNLAKLAIIDGGTNLRAFRQDLRTNEVYYHLAPGLGTT
jgi:L-arabinose isomerase